MACGLDRQLMLMLLLAAPGYCDAQQLLKRMTGPECRAHGGTITSWTGDASSVVQRGECFIPARPGGAGGTGASRPGPAGLTFVTPPNYPDPGVPDGIRALPSAARSAGDAMDMRLPSGTDPHAGAGLSDEYCRGLPRTREGYVHCFRTNAAALAALGRRCQVDATAMGPLDSSRTGSSGFAGQRGALSECADLYDRAARAEQCVADAVAAGGQVNPSMAACRQKFGI